MEEKDSKLGLQFGKSFMLSHPIGIAPFLRDHVT